MKLKLNVCLALLCCLTVSMRAPAEEQKIHVACVGDSITYGAGVEKREVNNYPVVLGKLLGDKYETKNFGVSGATLLRNGDNPYWKQGAFKSASDYQPQIVVIKLGTNDSKPQNWKHKDEFAKDLGDMVDQFAKLPSTPKIYLCLPAPAYAVQWGINEEIIKDQVIPIIQQVAKEKNLSTIDIHTALAGHPELFPDKIHPNAAGAALLAKAVAEAISK